MRGGNGCLPLNRGSVICGILSPAKVSFFHEKHAVGFSQPARIHLLSNRSVVLLGSMPARSTSNWVKAGHCEWHSNAFHSWDRVGPHTHRMTHIHIHFGIEGAQIHPSTEMFNF